MAASEEGFHLTPDEAGRLRDALKDKEFRKLLAEYADEISNPENKKRYEQEITELERMRGVDAKFINPTPGFVLKTVSLPDNVKTFVNVCQSEAVEKATATRGTGERGQRGQQWSIPFSLSPSREDVDKAKKKCQVFDAVFHPETFQKGQENPRFKQLLVDTALDGIERELHVKLDRSNVKHLRMPYKGMSVPTVIRKKMDEENTKSSPGSDLPFTVPYPPLKEDDKSGKKKKKEEKGENSPKKQKEPKPPDEPRYHVLHRDDLSMQDFTNTRESTLVRRPRELVVTVELPKVDSTVGVELDIFEKRILLETSEPHYKLDLALPYPVEEEKAEAKFDKTKKTLTITLPVVPLQTTPTPVRPLVTEVALETTNHVQEPESHDSRSETNSTNQNTEAVPHQSTNQDAQVQSPDLDTKPTNQKADLTTGTPQQWTSTGSYECPPFSHRQDEERVCFVLHTSGVKEKSLVSHFDQHQIQLTFSTATSAGGQFYSLYLKFPEECVLCVEECKVDVGVENVVVVGRKAEESRVTWERFEVGSTSTQTTEKLFLTAANVQSAMAQLDSLPDQWAHGEGSDGMTCKVSTVSDKVLEITISNSERHAKTSSGEADSRGEEREMGEGGRGGERGGGRERGGGGGGGGGGGKGGERERGGGEGEGGEGEGGGGGEGEREGERGEEGGGRGREEKGRGGGGQCEETLPEEAKVVEHSKEQTKRNTTDSDEQGLNCSTGDGEGGEQEAAEGEVTREGGGGGGTGHGGDAGTKTKSTVQLSNKLIFALD